MPRPMTSAMLAAIAASDLYPVIFAELTFRTGPVYLFSGFGSFSWNGQTWIGIGDLGSISQIEEGSDVIARGLSLQLSGFDATLLQDALGEVQLGLPVIIYLGFFSAGTLVASPIVAWSGRMDQPTFEVDGSAASITIACESRLIDMNVSVNKRYSDDQQQIDAPGDTAFSFVMGITNATIYWGATPNSPNNI